MDNQQSAFHEAVVTRDTTSQELRRISVRQIVSESVMSGDEAPLRQLVAGLERRLGGEMRRNTYDRTTGGCGSLRMPPADQPLSARFRLIGDAGRHDLGGHFSPHAR